MRKAEGNRTRAVAAIVALSLATATLACARSTDANLPGQVGSIGSPQSAASQAPIEASTQAQPLPLPTATAASVFRIGDDIHIGDWNLAVLGWSEVPGTTNNSPRAGQRFVAVDVVLVNVAQGPRTLSPLLQMSLKDDGNRKYDWNLAAQAASGTGLPSGEVNPGERVRGLVGFQVPQDASGLTFVFDAAVIGSGKAVVALGDQPQALDAPSGMIPGEQTQAAFAIGDTIDAGNLRLIVNSFREVPGTTIFHPDPGDHFVAVDLTLTNTSGSPLSISSVLQMKLKDSTGQSYNLHLGAQAAAASSPPDGELSPGESLRGEVAYQVPTAAQGLLFVFDPNLVGFGKVTVALTP